MVRADHHTTNVDAAQEHANDHASDLPYHPGPTFSGHWEPGPWVRGRFGWHRESVWADTEKETI